MSCQGTKIQCQENTGYYYVWYFPARCRIWVKGGKMPDLAYFGPKLYYKNAIKIDSAGIAVFAYYEVPDLDLIEPENTNPSYYLLIYTTLYYVPNNAITGE
jgi:hypothetical protein